MKIRCRRGPGQPTGNQGGGWAGSNSLSDGNGGGRATQAFDFSYGSGQGGVDCVFETISGVSTKGSSFNRDENLGGSGMGTRNREPEKRRLNGEKARGRKR